MFLDKNYFSLDRTLPIIIKWSLDDIFFHLTVHYYHQVKKLLVVVVMVVVVMVVVVMVVVVVRLNKNLFHWEIQWTNKKLSGCGYISRWNYFLLDRTITIKWIKTFRLWGSLLMKTFFFYLTVHSVKTFFFFFIWPYTQLNFFFFYRTHTVHTHCTHTLYTHTYTHKK